MPAVSRRSKQSLGPDLEDDDDLPDHATLAGLMEAWNACDSCRDIALGQKSFLQWPSDKHVGVISFETMGRNGAFLEKVLKIWCPQLQEPKTVPIDSLRDEVGFVFPKT